MAKVILLKLKTGEEVIGKLEEEKGDKIVLSDVRVVMAHPGPDGRVGVGFIPWMMGAPDKDIELAKSMIGGKPTDEAPSKELEDGYLQQTSGIAFATASQAPGIQT